MIGFLPFCPRDSSGAVDTDYKTVSGGNSIAPIKLLLNM
jgi:hypothetical protein